MNRLTLAVVVVLVTVTCGCQQSDVEYSLRQRIDRVEQEKEALAAQVRSLQAREKQLEKRISILSGLDEKHKAGELYDLQKVELGRYTGLYDKDDDGRKETFICYINTSDEQGDSIKVMGQAEIELWDLSLDQSNAKIGNWQIGSEKLEKSWFTSLIGAHYRLTFKLDDNADYAGRELTVKMSFTDYLTGMVYQDQKVIRP